MNQVNELKSKLKGFEASDSSNSKLDQQKMIEITEERDKLKKKLETTIKENWHKQKQDQRYLEDVLNAYSKQTEVQVGDQDLV